MRTYIFKLDEPGPTQEEAQEFPERFAMGSGSDMVMVVGEGTTMDAVLDTLKSAGFGGTEVVEPLPRKSITCEKPTGPPVKLIGDQTEGVHLPHVEPYQRSARAVSREFCEDEGD